MRALPPLTRHPHQDFAHRPFGQPRESGLNIFKGEDSVNHGLLPRDTLQKLKRIEKLSKHLRSELLP